MREGLYKLELMHCYSDTGNFSSTDPEYEMVPGANVQCVVRKDGYNVIYRKKNFKCHVPPAVGK